LCDVGKLCWNLSELPYAIVGKGYTMMLMPQWLAVFLSQLGCSKEVEVQIQHRGAANHTG
jgi:hypothetical protein